MGSIPHKARKEEHVDYWSKTLTGRRPLGKSGIYCWIILKWILQKLTVKICTILSHLLW